DIGQGGERGIRSAHVTILSVGPARNDTHPIAPGSLKTLFTCELVSDRVRGESVHQLNALSRPGDLSLRSVGESFVGEALDSYRLLSVLILAHVQPPVEHRADHCVDLRNLVFPTIQFRCPMVNVLVYECDP